MRRLCGIRSVYVSAVEEECDLNMSRVVELVISLRKRGVKLWAEGGQLHFRAPRGELLAADVDLLRSLKQQVLEVLEPLAIRTASPLQPRLTGSRVPLTGMQVPTWRRCSDVGKTRVPRFFAFGYRLRGTLRGNALERSIETVLHRHESLRTRIVAVDRDPQQVIDPVATFRLDVVDLSHLSRGGVEIELKRRTETFIGELISWDVGPMFAARLFKVSTDDHILIVTVDHMITDTASNAILRAEMWSVYRDIAANRPSSIPHLFLQFPDYAVWQSQRNGAWLHDHGDYWIRRLAGAPAISLPFDPARTDVAPGTAAAANVAFDAGVSVGVRELGRKHGTFPALVMFTLYAAAIARWSLQRDLVITFVESGRSRVELVNMVGYLTNHLYLRVELSAADRFSDLLKIVQREFAQALKHEDFNRVPLLVPECACAPFGDAALYFNWLPTNRGASVSQKRLVDGANEQEGLHAELYPVKRKMPPFQLGTFVSQLPDGRLAATIIYRADLLLGDTIQQLMSHWTSAAQEFVEDPNALVVRATARIGSREAL